MAFFYIVESSAQHVIKNNYVFTCVFAVVWASVRLIRWVSLCQGSTPILTWPLQGKASQSLGRDSSAARGTKTGYGLKLLFYISLSIVFVCVTEVWQYVFNICFLLGFKRKSHSCKVSHTKMSGLSAGMSYLGSGFEPHRELPTLSLMSIR